MHTPLPLDGSARLFQIGTKPLAIADWFAPDAAMAAQLAEKAVLLREKFAAVYAEEPDSHAAQAELLDVMAAELPKTHPHLWQREGSGIRVIPTGELVTLDDGDSPLLTAARLVQDDLLLLQRDDAGWRLTAASLCFPSSWVLTDKMGKRLDATHDPVPGFGPGTRAAQVMARMFDAARPETPMIRWNFSLCGDARLFYPDVSGPDNARFGTGERADPVVLRTERQTLRKLPQTGAMAFTIRISLDALSDLERRPDAAAIAAVLIGQIEALTAEQLDYKGLTRERERVLARLRDLCPA